MKLGIISALAFIFLVNGDDGIHVQAVLRNVNPYDHLLRIRSVDNLQVCQPGSTKKDDCNTCFCIGDGSGWGCTEIGCSPPGITFPINSESSTVQSKEDDPPQRSKREEVHDPPSSQTQGQICIPGSTRMEDCNHCFCTKVGWACTLRGCLQSAPYKTEAIAEV